MSEALEPEYAMSLGEIAKELGLKKSHVHRIEQRALAKLRKHVIKRGLEL